MHIRTKPKFEQYNLHFSPVPCWSVRDYKFHALGISIRQSNLLGVKMCKVVVGICTKILHNIDIKMVSIADKEILYLLKTDNQS